VVHLRLFEPRAARARREERLGEADVVPSEDAVLGQRREPPERVVDVGLAVPLLRIEAVVSTSTKSSRRDARGTFAPLTTQP
jgi:hypothetical protein